MREYYSQQVKLLLTEASPGSVGALVGALVGTLAGLLVGALVGVLVGVLVGEASQSEASVPSGQLSGTSHTPSLAHSHESSPEFKRRCGMPRASGARSKSSEIHTLAVI
jgi:hypothetical protein